MNTRELASVVTAFIVLAGISVAILRGGQTAGIIQASSNGFANVLKAATATGS